MSDTLTVLTVWTANTMQLPCVLSYLDQVNIT